MINHANQLAQTDDSPELTFEGLSPHQQAQLTQLRLHFGREMNDATFEDDVQEIERYWSKLYAVLQGRPSMEGVNPETEAGREFMLEHWKMLDRHFSADDDD